MPDATPPTETLSEDAQRPRGHDGELYGLRRLKRDMHTYLLNQAGDYNDMHDAIDGVEGCPVCDGDPDLGHAEDCLLYRTAPGVNADQETLPSLVTAPAESDNPYITTLRRLVRSMAWLDQVELCEEDRDEDAVDAARIDVSMARIAAHRLLGLPDEADQVFQDEETPPHSGAPSASAAGGQGPAPTPRPPEVELVWTRTPDYDGHGRDLFWHWSGDPQHAPVPLSISRSGFTGKLFVMSGQYGIRDAIDVDDYGGWWTPVREPAIPDEYDDRCVGGYLEAPGVTPAAPPGRRSGQ